MRRNPEAKGTDVELLNVPRYGQGAFDSLCAYYTGAMMLATLFPEYAVEFGKAMPRATKYMSLDPLIREYGSEDNRKVLARWFYHGESIEKVVRILNANMGLLSDATRFTYMEMDRRERTFDDTIVRSVDEGLPVMLGWNTEDYGCHAVLVTGYWIGKEKWLKTADPGGATEVSWNSVKAQQKGNGLFEVGLCTRHAGPRPLKSVTKDEAPVVYQWTPQQEYVALNDLFAATLRPVAAGSP